MINKDHTYMQRALTLALRARGKTSPNPLVGCVIVKAGKIIAEGWHKRCGGDHAEVAALNKAGDKARGATMYVTLEPCSHWGRTPPCVDSILKAGIKRVVAAMVDPNPVNNGRSLKILKEHGVDVTLGIGEQGARIINRPFIKHITKKMPFIVAKIAQSRDGKTIPGGRSRWITAPATRLWAKRKRNFFDAIMVGVNTLITDDPRLDAPGKSLKKIVVDSRLRVPEKARIFRITQPGDIIIATTRRAPQAKLCRMINRGVQVLIVDEKDGRVDLKRLFKELAKIGITSILIEGGAILVSQALMNKLVDKLHIYMAPKVLGKGKEKGGIDGRHIQRLARALKFEIMDIQKIGQDAFIKLCSPELLK